MVSRIEIFCKLLSRSQYRQASSSTASTPGPGIRVSHNRISTPGGGSWSEFTKVFNADSKNTNELYSATCGSLTQCFVNGYNASLVLLGTRECLQGLLTDGKGPFMFLTEHLTHVSGKHLKNKGVSSSRMFIPTDNESLPFVNVKDSVLMKVYVLNGGGDDIQDLSRGRQSSTSLSDAKPFLECDYSTGSNVQNIRGSSLLENSSKESCKYLGSTLRNIDLINSWPDESCLVVEYMMTKRSESSATPQTSSLRIILLVTSQGICRRLDTVCKADFFQEKMFNHSSLDTLTLYLSDVIGGNCVTKAIVFMDGTNGAVTETLMKISNGLRNVQNHPVLVTPLFKRLVTRYHNTINKLRNDNVRSRSKNKQQSDELEKRLMRSEQAYKDVCKEKEELTRKLQELHGDYRELIARHEDVSSEKAASATANLKVEKELVDLKLKGTTQQQVYHQQFEALKLQSMKDQDRTEKLERDLKLERRLHEELKQKFTKLNQSNSELNEEYLNLKVNLHNMVDKFDEQNKHLQDQEKAMSALLQGKEKVANKNNFNVNQQKKEFIGHLIRMSSMFGNAESDKILLNDNVSSVNDYINNLEDKITKWKESYSEKEKALLECRKQSAERVTTAEILEEENKKLKRNYSVLKKTLEQLSKDYQQRLQTYIENIKEFIGSKSSDTNNNLRNEAQEMTSSQQSAVLEDVDRLKKDLQEVQKEKTVLLIKYKRLMVAYRQSCDKYGMFDISLPTDEDVELFQTKKQIELEEDLKSSQLEIQKLQAKLEIMDKWKHNGYDPILRDKKSIKKAPSQSREHQIAVEREKAELLSRCIMAEQEVESLRAIKDQEIESLQNEIAYLRHYIEQSAHPPIDQTNLLPQLSPMRYRNGR